MRELTATEIHMASGGNDSTADEALFYGAATGFFGQLAQGARLGAALGPKGALGGAIIGGTIWGAGTIYSYFRDS